MMSNPKRPTTLNFLLICQQLAEFDNVIFKKEVSPLDKWAIVEGLTTYLHIGEHYQWMSKLYTIAPLSSILHSSTRF
jgi:hypothetical protein